MELDECPRLIETLEAEQADLYHRMADPDFYRRGKEGVTETKQRLETIKNLLEKAYARWEELEAIKENSGI
jgi:ATP-binding cassette subfamily F protein uup